MGKTLISKMFVGSYNDENIGHEVINFYKPDGDDKFIYLYIPPLGNVAQNVENVVLVGPSDGYLHPVLAIAKNPIMLTKESTENLQDKIEYGGVAISKVQFQQIKDDRNIEVQKLNFKVAEENYYKPSKTIFLVGKEAKDKSAIIKRANEKGGEVVFVDEKGLNRQMAYVEFDVVKEIESKVGIKSYKVDKVDVFAPSKYPYIKNSLIGFIHKEYDETAYSNMLYDILKTADEPFRKEFVKDILGITLQNDIKILDKEVYTLTKSQKLIKKGNKDAFKTQQGRIDLLIANEEEFIIIENKIKSGLNGLFVEEGETKTQIDKYLKFAEEFKKENSTYKNSNIKVVIFAPEYNKDFNVYADKGQKIPVVSYRKLSDFFGANVNKSIMHKYYDEFVNALHKHSLTKPEEINRRFVDVLISSIKSNSLLISQK